MPDVQPDKENQELLFKLLKQQNELSESLKYASSIQKALFPKDTVVKSIFPESFILFIPKDIVSGDFYWVHKSHNFSMVVVGDCTGHGVPGAFMSILGISFLNQIVAAMQTYNAAKVLNILREYMMNAMGQTGNDNEPKDGIDLALCILDYNTGQLQYAGAFNPVYIISDNNLVQLTADKMPIGVATEFETSFKNATYKMKHGDMLYLFTDGFADQFGGSYGKKYKYQSFRNLLLKTAGKPIHLQHNTLENEFIKWKGTHNQLDDVTIFGIRY